MVTSKLSKFWETSAGENQALLYKEANHLNSTVKYVSMKKIKLGQPWRSASSKNEYWETVAGSKGVRWKII